MLFYKSNQLLTQTMFWFEKDFRAKSRNLEIKFHRKHKFNNLKVPQTFFIIKLFWGLQYLK